MAGNTSRQTRPGALAPSRVLLVALIGLCAMFVFSYAERSVRKAQLETNAAEWERQIAEARQKNRALVEELAEVESDAYVDKAARDELGWAKENDVEIIVIEPTMTPASAISAATDEGTQNAKAGAPESSLPVWQQWLSLVASE